MRELSLISLLSKTMHLIISGFLADLRVSGMDFNPSSIFTCLFVGWKNSTRIRFELISQSSTIRCIVL